MNSKRLGQCLLGAVLIYLVFRTGIHFLPESPDYANLRLMKHHLMAIKADWEQFKSSDQRFEFVQIYFEPGSNGLFGIRGRVPSAAAADEVTRFIRDTHPPRPVYTNELQIVSSLSDSPDAATADGSPGFRELR